MNKLTSSYSMTSKQIQSYLHSIIDKWPKIDTSTGKSPTSTPSGLYVTYIPINNPIYIGDRMDIYDNSLLANSLIIVNNTNTPDPIVTYILDFLAGAITWLTGPTNPNKNVSKLIVAAYGFSAPSYDSGNIADQTQDVGNNSMVGIAFAKFCLTYPNHEKTKLYYNCVQYLVSTFLNNMSCDNKGIIGHFPIASGKNYISTEHMIDCYALAILGEQLKITSSTTLKNMVQTFVKNAYDKKSRYYIGSTTTGCDTLNIGEYPVDVNTWNMLSGVDDIQTNKFNSLKWVYDNTIVSDTNNPGIEFAASKLYEYTGSKCSQYENTGSFLCALSQYTSKFNDDIYSKLNPDNKTFDLIYSFIYNKINSNTKIQAAYAVNTPAYKGGCNGTGCCSFIGGNPWQYNQVYHLGSSIYCSLSLLYLTQNANIYQLSNSNPNPPPNPPPTSSSNKLLLIIGLIVVSILLILLLRYLFIIRNKNA